MKKNKLAAILLCLVMLLSLAAACGGNGTDTSPSQSSSASGTPSASASGAAPASPSSDTSASGTPDASSSPNTSTAAGSERSKVVTIGETQRVRGIDPHQAQDTGTTAVLNYMYEGLITYSRNVEGDGLGPADEIGLLAESWEVDPDQMFWTFKLREDVYFHNGQHMTADDVVCTFQRLIDRRDELNISITEWALLESVEKLGEYEVRINFSSPYAWAGASFIATNIIPHEAYEEMGDELWNQQIACGTGPWMLEDWLDGQYTYFKKNPNYWGKATYDPYFEELYHRFIAEPSSGVAAILSGDIDVLSSPSGVDTMMLPQFTGQDHLELIERKTLFYYYIQWKCDPSNMFADENIRKAFSLAIDRQLIVDGVFGGAGYVSETGFFANGVDGSDPGMTHVYDPAEGQRLLEASSYNGEELSLVTTQSMPKAEEFALAVADMANAIGFNVVVYTEEPGVYSDRRFGGLYDMYVGYTSINNVPGGARRHFNQITTDMYHHGMAENPNLDFAQLQSLIETYYTAKSNEIAFDAALEYNRYTKEHMAPQSDILFLYATNVQAKGITGVKYTESGINTFKYVDWAP